MLKKYKLPGSDEILAKLIHAGGGMLVFAAHTLVNSIWIKEELPDHQKESINLLVYKKGNKMYCSNYRDISLLSTSYKIKYPSLKVGPYIDDFQRSTWNWYNFSSPTYIFFNLFKIEVLLCVLIVHNCSQFILSVCYALVYLLIHFNWLNLIVVNTFEDMAQYIIQIFHN
jgi:hypothetical protein